MVTLGQSKTFSCKITYALILAIWSLAYCHSLQAAPPTLKNSVEKFNPANNAEDINNEKIENEKVPAESNIKIINSKPQNINQQSVKIKFTLRGITLTGNKKISTYQLQKLYQDKINTEISLTDLARIAHKITDYYRNSGYVLSQAIIPPQEIAEDGIVHIRIIEGYIKNVSISGCKNITVCKLLKAYGDNIIKNAPLTLADLERFSFLANDIPGTEVRAVLSRSEADIGAAELNFIVKEKNLEGYVAYNNYNSVVLGRQQFVASAQMNNLTTASETAINGNVSRNTDRLRYVSLTHKQQLNSNGLGIALSVNNINTDPDMESIGLSNFEIPGKAFILTTAIDYAWIRSNNQNLYIGSGVNFTNSSTRFSGLTLFKDDIRSINIFASYNFLQSSNTFNTITATITQGLKILGAEGSPPSRTGEKLDFTKLELYASNAHKFKLEKFSSLIAIKAQYGFNILPSSETFSYGGIPFGYGYDPSTISGDRGIDARAELQYKSFSVLHLKLQSQLFVFADCGFVWSLNNIQPTRQSGSSIGGGYRANSMQHINLDLIIAKPLNPSINSNNANYLKVMFNIKIYA